MTGNLVLLGFGIAGGSGLPMISPFVSPAAFLAGVVPFAALLALVLDITPNQLCSECGAIPRARLDPCR